MPRYRIELSLEDDSGLFRNAGVATIADINSDEAISAGLSKMTPPVYMPRGDDEIVRQANGSFVIRDGYLGHVALRASPIAKGKEAAEAHESKKRMKRTKEKLLSADRHISRAQSLLATLASPMARSKDESIYHLSKEVDDILAEARVRLKRGSSS